MTNHKNFWSFQTGFEGSQDHVNKLLEGTDTWNAWQAEDPDKRIRFTNLNLSPDAVRGTKLWEDDNCRAGLCRLNLRNTHFEGGSFADADLFGANLRGCTLSQVDLSGTRLVFAVVDGTTRLYYCRYDRKTDCTGVVLGDIQFRAPGDPAYLERNIREISWKSWGKHNAKISLGARAFWSLSDYGASTTRLISWFFLFAFLFSIIYCLPGIVVGIHDYKLNEVTHSTPIWLIPVRSMYFSVVTMTTLGFGDIHANPEPTFSAVCGHFLLSLQVLLGYFMLGALITRLSILFQSPGAPPAFGPRDIPRKLEPTPSFCDIITDFLKKRTT